ncbi:alanine--tRNA ligase [Acidaminobacter sp. JC074]|uniref:alanine--tRNA ligase n=1 Tax=Acidaminobacter sp. JC074 TaxID=2530199 RepID=UPI001F0E0B69|nr:alanine--tRNA ligase [Acidaminobacter sp. JC074]MCH4889532.1 alanine--tRNA ligase [Acidaminobacter sp. JC074]
MKSNELRQMHLKFYQERRHQLAAAASLIPENDGSVLYVSAGMQPLIPYLKGKKHPQGKRLTNIQRCIRTDDIDEVGDDYHLTMFEMMGNWSLGDYFKEEAIKMSFDFLTGHIGIEPCRLAVTVYKGNDQVPADLEAVKTWQSLGLKDSQIFYYGDDENWWGPVGETGPCGPDSEMFYINDLEDCCTSCGPACDCGKYVEIGNNVFMTYNKLEDGSLVELDQKNIDVGLGFERLLIIKNNLENVYETDLFMPTIKVLEDLSGLVYDTSNQKYFRVIAEHMRASVFILSDPSGIKPTNSEQGYILRRLIRRTIRMCFKLGLHENILKDLAGLIIDQYKAVYDQLEVNKAYTLDQLDMEYKKFSVSLESGLKYVHKYLNKLNDHEVLSGKDAFKLYDTYGFPLELTVEVANEYGKSVDVNQFERCFKEHQGKSRSGSVNKFKGGLSDHDDMSIKLHTATHLLNAALRKVLGDSVYQRGSHINSERLRFDFSFDRKMTREEIDEVEGLVNEVISNDLDVTYDEMSLDQARKLGAIGVFESKYDDKVKVYRMGDFSLEICGGPHVENTSELGRFKIVKEQSSSSGVRRIKAVLE